MGDGRMLLMIEDGGTANVAKSAKARKSAMGMMSKLDNAVSKLSEEDGMLQRPSSGGARRLSLGEGMLLPAGDDGHCIRDQLGKPLVAKKGILTFDRETWEVPVST